MTDASAFLLALGKAAWAALADPAREQAVIRAADFMEEAGRGAVRYPHRRGHRRRQPGPDLCQGHPPAAVGNRLDLRDVADWSEPFDATMADICSAQTGVEGKEVAERLDA